MFQISSNFIIMIFQSFSEVIPNFFGISSEFVPILFTTYSKFVPNSFQIHSELIRNPNFKGIFLDG